MEEWNNACINYRHLNSGPQKNQSRFEFQKVSKSNKDYERRYFIVEDRLGSLSIQKYPPSQEKIYGSYKTRTRSDGTEFRKPNTNVTIIYEIVLSNLSLLKFCIQHVVEEKQGHEVIVILPCSSVYLDSLPLNCELQKIKKMLLDAEAKSPYISGYCESYSEKKWSELPLKAKKCAQNLGFRRETWGDDGDDGDDSYDVQWKDPKIKTWEKIVLDSELLDSALYLGFREKNWGKPQKKNTELYVTVQPEFDVMNKSFEWKNLHRYDKSRIISPCFKDNREWAHSLFEIDCPHYYNFIGTNTYEIKINIPNVVVEAGFVFNQEPTIDVYDLFIFNANDLLGTSETTTTIDCDTSFKAKVPIFSYLYDILNVKYVKKSPNVLHLFLTDTRNYTVQILHNEKSSDTEIRLENKNDSTDEELIVEEIETYEIEDMSKGLSYTDRITFIKDKEKYTFYNAGVLGKEKVKSEEEVEVQSQVSTTSNSKQTTVSTSTKHRCRDVEKRIYKWACSDIRDKGISYIKKLNSYFENDAMYWLTEPKNNLKRELYKCFIDEIDESIDEKSQDYVCMLPVDLEENKHEAIDCEEFMLFENVYFCGRQRHTYIYKEFYIITKTNYSLQNGLSLDKIDFKNIPESALRFHDRSRKWLAFSKPPVDTQVDTQSKQNAYTVYYSQIDLKRYDIQYVSKEVNLQTQTIKLVYKYGSETNPTQADFENRICFESETASEKMYAPKPTHFALIMNGDQVVIKLLSNDMYLSPFVKNGNIKTLRPNQMGNIEKRGDYIYFEYIPASQGTRISSEFQNMYFKILTKPDSLQTYEKFEMLKKLDIKKLDIEKNENNIELTLTFSNSTRTIKLSVEDRNIYQDVPFFDNKVPIQDKGIHVVSNCIFQEDATDDSLDILDISLEKVNDEYKVPVHSIDKLNTYTVFRYKNKYANSAEKEYYFTLTLTYELTVPIMSMVTNDTDEPQNSDPVGESLRIDGTTYTIPRYPNNHALFMDNVQQKIKNVTHDYFFDRDILYDINKLDTFESLLRTFGSSDADRKKEYDKILKAWEELKYSFYLTGDEGVRCMTDIAIELQLCKSMIDNESIRIQSFKEIQDDMIMVSDLKDPKLKKSFKAIFDDLEKNHQQDIPEPASSDDLEDPTKTIKLMLSDEELSIDLQRILSYIDDSTHKKVYRNIGDEKYVSIVGYDKFKSLISSVEKLRNIVSTNMLSNNLGTADVNWLYELRDVTKDDKSGILAFAILSKPLYQTYWVLKLCKYLGHRTMTGKVLAESLISIDNREDKMKVNSHPVCMYVVLKEIYYFFSKLCKENTNINVIRYISNELFKLFATHTGTYTTIDLTSDQAQSTSTKNTENREKEQVRLKQNFAQTFMRL